MTIKTDDLRIKDMHVVTPPQEIRDEFPITENGANTVADTRKAVQNIIRKKDDRLLVVMGPCSIHDVEAGMEYASKYKALAEAYKDDLLLLMRVYFEKPRTTVGWKGLINDPNIDGSYDIETGLRRARKFLVDITDMGIPTAVEFLDLISPQYVAELVSWGAIGARTTESQVHRELASGLSCPVGFKNATDGGMTIAIDAIGASSKPHVFLSVTKEGRSAIFETTGNEDCHIILRGGRTPNYDAGSIARACEKLAEAGLTETVMVDFSHANSSKDYRRQPLVANDVSMQIADGNECITGVMIESHLVEGNQKADTLDKLTYGQSITDACINWETTEEITAQLAQAVRTRREELKG